MTMSRSLKRFVGRMLIGVLLSAQMAIAAYACPTLLSSQQPDSMAMTMPTGSSAVTDDGAMAGCEEMDNRAANLCAEHCHFGQQSADHPPTPTVPAALRTMLYPLPAQPEPIGRVRPHADMELAQVAASPPHAILHCCFRI